ncbi:MAG: hypothetical protein K2K98_03480 [Muribaculaceae bacterium]|nr:hypothetical protein [Muribaculaceae bacterium]
MAKKKYNSISDIPSDELKAMMIAFGQEKAKSVKSARAFLRTIGFEVSNKGVMTPAVNVSVTSAQ